MDVNEWIETIEWMNEWINEYIRKKNQHSTNVSKNLINCLMKIKNKKKFSLSFGNVNYLYNI